MTKKGRNRIKSQGLNRQSKSDLINFCLNSDNKDITQIRYPDFIKSDSLPDNYPVYYDYFYYTDNKLIKSDIEGTVLDLKRDLKSQNIEVKNIYKAKWDY